MTEPTDEPIDQHVVRRLTGWAEGDGLTPFVDPTGSGDDVERLLACYDAQVTSRRLDLAARWLQRRGEGFYTIGSSGHESNAAVALALRWPMAACGLYVVVAVMWLVPDRRIERTLHLDEDE